MFSGKILRLRHTLAFRLTLWYGIIFTISSCVAFIFFYILITSVLRDRTDQELVTQVGTFSSILAAKGLDAVRRVAVLEAQAAGEKKIFFRLLYPNGKAFSSSNMSYWQNIGVTRRAIQELIAGNRHVFETLAVPDRQHRVRILYSMIGPGIILQLGQSQESYTRFIEAFKRIFIASMSFLIVLAVLVGWFMARQALAGLGEVTKTAARISEGSLDERVPAKGGGDEIDQLATMFNHMLDRIQTLVLGIREMSDNIAHDLKSPVTRIRGLAEVTLTTETALDGYKSMAASTIEECDRLLDMINTMLVISKTEAGVDHLTFESVDLGSIVQGACDLYAPVAEDKGVELSCDVQGSCMVSADNRMLQRLIANLLDNAIKYTPQGGSVDALAKKADHGSLMVSISDTGIGISDEDIPHVFERFYRCDPSRSDGGIGLGLSLAKAIAEAHGGRITASSTKGKGSTFTVTLSELSPLEM
jgi:heavy metal sensor kinase